MKNTQKIKRVHLKINQNTGTLLFGLVSTEPDYKLSLSLNRKLNISLKQTLPVSFTEKKQAEIHFSRFTDSSVTGITYDLVSNRSGTIRLIKKLKNIDYFFHVHNSENEDITDYLVSLLRDTEYVTAVFILDPKLMTERNLLF